MAVPDFDEIVDDFRRAVERGELSAAFYAEIHGERVRRSLVLPGIDHPVDALGLIVRAAREAGLPRPTWACMASDSYAQTAQAEDSLRNLRRGTLAARFAGGDPTVRECIIVYLFHEDGTKLVAQQTYTRRHLKALNRETLDWDEVNRWEDADQLDGAIPDTLAGFWQ